MVNIRFVALRSFHCAYFDFQLMEYDVVGKQDHFFMVTASLDYCV